MPTPRRAPPSSRPSRPARSAARLVWVLVVALCCAAVRPAAPAQADEAGVSSEQIQRAIEKARDWLAREQENDGSWECAMRTQDTRVGATALVMLALANAGMRAEEPALRKSLDWLRRQEPEETYSVSLQTLVLAMLSPAADRAILQRNVGWLEQTQVATGPAAGSWSYGKGKGTGDNSNSQFALLALHEAARAGARVKPDVWMKAQQYWVSCANADGSWGYTIGNVAGTGSMTCAGIASVWITAEHIGTPDAQAGRDTVSCCGGGTSPKVLERGLDWLGKRFSVRENPGGGATWHYYYLYGLERVGRFTARRFIGQADWYLEGARVLVASQDQLSGAFRGGRIEDPIVATSFALLFLAKGRRPVVVAKSRHDPGTDWNRHGHDIAHLVEHVEAQWKKDYPACLSFHVFSPPPP
ncbi:MAG: prenyltransferase/squalene oxidase repeat-containing protein, partial [Planctomycetia bacterium]